MNVALKEDVPRRVLLPVDDDRFDGVWAFRVEFTKVSGEGSVPLKLHILGCAEGRITIYEFS